MQSLFNKADIVNNVNIELVDSDPEYSLELYSCREDVEPTAYLKRCRGLVFQGETFITKAFSFVDEYTSTDFGLEYPESEFGKYRFYPSYEGTLLRVYYVKKPAGEPGTSAEGKWFISTHRKLDASKSRWGSAKSFKQLFVQGVMHDLLLNTELDQKLNITDESCDFFTEFCSVLDKDKQYAFLLRSTENRIVSHTGMMEPHVYHVGTFKDGLLIKDTDLGITQPQELKFVHSSELIDYVDASDPMCVQGVIGIDTENDRQIKVYSREYANLRDLRGNQPNLYVRYFELHNDSERTMAFLRLYPNLKEWSKTAENRFERIASLIHKAYMQRYIHKEYVSLPQKLFNVMKKCHDWHCSNPAENKVFLQVVREKLGEESAFDLWNIISELD